MRCDDIKRRIDGGEPLDADVREHVASCPACGEEFAFLGALKPGAPPATLRGRVLAAMPRRRFRWSIAAVAASVALALGLGFAAGRALPSPARVEIHSVVVVKPMDEREVFCMAVALATVYRTQVDCEFDGMTCRRIRADRAVLKMLPYCPIVQQMDRVAQERPDLVVLR